MDTLNDHVRTSPTRRSLQWSHGPLAMDTRGLILFALPRQRTFNGAMAL